MDRYYLLVDVVWYYSGIVIIIVSISIKYQCLISGAMIMIGFSWMNRLEIDGQDDGIRVMVLELVSLFDVFILVELLYILLMVLVLMVWIWIRFQIIG